MIKKYDKADLVHDRALAFIKNNAIQHLTEFHTARLSELLCHLKVKQGQTQWDINEAQKAQP